MTTFSLAELAELAVECARSDWDGYGAAPVSPASIERAKRLILALPADFNSPAVGAHPDGQVALTWHGRSTDFSVSVGPAGHISYAGIFGPSVVSYGGADFTDDLPAAILDHLRRLL